MTTRVHRIAADTAAHLALAEALPPAAFADLSDWIAAATREAAAAAVQQVRDDIARGRIYLAQADPHDR
jgi:hypothetical protein